MEQLGNELASYKEDKSGNKVINGGILKEFTDKNYKVALNSGEGEVSQAVENLSQSDFPDFETFKQAREKVAADLDNKLQKNVAYPELSDKFIKTLNHLSTKTGLKFDISAAEKEKEKIMAEAAEKEIENEKKKMKNYAKLSLIKIKYKPMFKQKVSIFKNNLKELIVK